jgi:hypothetical protein
MGPGWAKKFEIFDGPGMDKKSYFFIGPVWVKKIEIFDGSGVGKKS